MITYELAKKLKDAGFPQTGENVVSLLSVEERVNSLLVGESAGYVCIPTLEELIEACGYRFNNLTKDAGLWHTNFIQGSEYDYGETEGKTSSEAVAKLWLKIKKK